ncbi:hypothetical protein B296_00057300 [Ensete ventricosum]|uniref:Uncharacterized protein n=1 Tax=Ensete ventricosum TaxID=4639 RepID=A0A426XRQ8_ENSVE|nr:hypothetical protein B296_00057300 [Ensete ventricosum]
MCMAFRGSTCGKRSRSKKTGSAKMRGRRTWMTLTAPHSAVPCRAVPSLKATHRERERERERSSHALMQVAGYRHGCRRSNLVIMMLGEKRNAEGIERRQIEITAASEMLIRRDGSAHGGVSHWEKEAPRRDRVVSVAVDLVRLPCIVVAVVKGIAGVVAARAPQEVGVVSSAAARSFLASHRKLAYRPNASASAGFNPAALLK